MKIKNIYNIHSSKPVPLYDVIGVEDVSNFLIPLNTGVIVSHNCNFGKVASKDLQGVQGQMMKLYESTKSRQQTRFSYRNGRVRGMMILVSSKRSDLDFLDNYIQKVKGNEGVYIVDEPVWNVRPKEEFSEITFKVAVGDKNHQSMILQDNITKDELTKLESEGYTILDVPDNLRQRFEGNLERNIMDLAGISVANLMKFISSRNYNACINPTRQNPFTSEVLTIGTKDNQLIQHFFRKEAIPSYLWQKPLYIHIDGAKGASSGADLMGISGVWQYGIYEKNVDTEEEQDYEAVNSNYEIKYMHAFTVGIKGPDGAQIDWSKARSFIYWLRGIGLNVKGISIDGYQSLEMQQILAKKGFNVKQLSLDIKTTGWDTAKQVINEQRIDILPNDLLEKEVTQLEVNVQHSKVDHPIDGCFTGDTQVLLCDGRKLSFLQLVEEYEAGKINYVYAFDRILRRVVKKRIKKVWKTKENVPIVAVKLQTGQVIKCTPNHLFLLKNGSYVEANYLLHGNVLRAMHEDIYVESVRLLEETADVYDLEVPVYHNFALATGVFVHNSKDCADSFAGALWNAVLNSDAFVEEYASELNTEMYYDDAPLRDTDKIKMKLMESLAKNGEQSTQDMIRNILHKQDVLGVQPDVEQFTEEQKQEYNRQVEERRDLFVSAKNGVYVPETLTDPDIFLF